MNAQVYDKINSQKGQMAQQQTILTRLERDNAPQFKIDHCKAAIALHQQKIDFLYTQIHF